MDKIPTLFQREGPKNNFKAVDRLTKGCEWIFTHPHMTITEKLDGTNVRITVRAGQVVRVEKRCNPNKGQKKAGIINPWYVDTNNMDNADRWVLEAVGNTDVTEWEDGEHCCEALGPKIQGNSLGLDTHRCVPFDIHLFIYPICVPIYTVYFCLDEEAPFFGLADFLRNLDSLYSPGRLAEGIVLIGEEGQRAKLKRSDFDYE